MNRVNLSFDDTEYKVVLTAANRDGEMALGAWIARQAMAVAQGTLIPVSRDAGDVLRELIRSRLHLQETVAALHALATPAVPFPVAPGTPSSRPRTAVLPPAPDPVSPGPGPCCSDAGSGRDRQGGRGDRSGHARTPLADMNRVCGR
ncbi:hypothetical protein [Streptomyces sp. JV180]|uniref:hypothetical protein n=1 Tax=Streptomyces sp. JV180 TaxID=858634 RepID=UPI001CC31767|nr:hypothetical protein [Streptomyces sp. JV180]